ncbi:hypothetical protein SAMN06265218_1199 [Fodinibius sediminis]|uniref:Uncharacterized protein n=1 Tax=Fodinibius sediminis TaxID=1214077 RepID=A0A521EU74_9BACT|nr:hypothetical protein SAMN06265218_1199 [Fodinibius sediminis]
MIVDRFSITIFSKRATGAGYRRFKMNVGNEKNLLQ